MSKGIPTEDFFGTFFVSKSDQEDWDSYYNTIVALKPLFTSEEFRKIIHGFYLNKIGKSLRISYFVNKNDSDNAISTFRTFFTKNKIMETANSSAPHEDIIAAGYGGLSYEQRFRNFLANYTQIGLELLEGNSMHSRRLFTVYRFKVRQASVPFEDYFEPTFVKYSSSYFSFSDEEKHQFLTDLKEWPNPPQFDWAHMMVNMIVGYDWLYFPFMHPLPLPITKINEILIRENIGFQIPPTWNSKSFDL